MLLLLRALAFAGKDSVGQPASLAFFHFTANCILETDTSAREGGA